jgi:hypothetical protein
MIEDGVWQPTKTIILNGAEMWGGRHSRHDGLTCWVCAVGEKAQILALGV